MTPPKSAIRGPVGRPVISRELIGYAGELQSLARIRQACLGDTRLSMRAYVRISKALQLVEKELRILSSVKEVEGP